MTVHPGIFSDNQTTARVLWLLIELQKQQKFYTVNEKQCMVIKWH